MLNPTLIPIPARIALAVAAMGTPAFLFALVRSSALRRDNGPQRPYLPYS